MSEPKPREYLANPPKFRLNPDPKWTWPTGGTVAGLRAAVLQQRVVRSLNQLIAEEALPVPRVADLLGIPRSTLYAVLLGSQPMGTAHLAAFLAFTDRLPSMQDLRQRLIMVSAHPRLAAEIKKAGGRSGDLMPRTSGERRALETLSVLNGVEALSRTAEDDRRDRVLAHHAWAALRESARRLAADQGLCRGPGAPDSQPCDQTVITSRLPGNTEPVAVDGFWTPDGPLLSAALPADWARTVADEGWATIVGRFVVQVRERDASGRPATVLVLDLAGCRDEESVPARDDMTWEYRSVPARVRWESYGPDLDFRPA